MARAVRAEQRRWGATVRDGSTRQPEQNVPGTARLGTWSATDSGRPIGDEPLPAPATPAATPAATRAPDSPPDSPPEIPPEPPAATPELPPPFSAPARRQPAPMIAAEPMPAAVPAPPVAPMPLPEVAAPTVAPPVAAPAPAPAPIPMPLPTPMPSAPQKALRPLDAPPLTPLPATAAPALPAPPRFEAVAEPVVVPTPPRPVPRPLTAVEPERLSSPELPKSVAPPLPEVVAAPAAPIAPASAERPTASTPRISGPANPPESPRDARVGLDGLTRPSGGAPDAGARVGHDVATLPSSSSSAPRLNLELPARERWRDFQPRLARGLADDAAPARNQDQAGKGTSRRLPSPIAARPTRAWACSPWCPLAVDAGARQGLSLVTAAQRRAAYIRFIQPSRRRARSL